MQNAKKGFTLIETLIALAILAIALLAALRATHSHVDTVSEIKWRTQAAWVATNQINLLRMSKNFPDLGASSGRATQGEEEFTWYQEVTVSPNYSFRRVELKVSRSHDPQRTLARQVSYVARQS